MPLVGGAIGYLTNHLAVRMIFRPIEPRRFLGLRLQGLIGRRQGELAASIGRVVGSHLVKHEDVVAALSTLDVETLVDRLVGGMLTDQRVADLRRSFTAGLLRDSEGLVEEFERAVEQGLDVQAIVTRKVAEFPIERLEALILEVASRELAAIELLGGLLGLLVGLARRRCCTCSDPPTEPLPPCPIPGRPAASGAGGSALTCEGAESSLERALPGAPEDNLRAAPFAAR